MKLSDEAIKLIYESVELDLVRYEDEDMFTELLRLHSSKINYLIGRNRFKNNEDLINFLVKYRDTFKSISYPRNGVY